MRVEETTSFDNETKMKILDLTAADQRFENGLFWQRSLFFWGFIAATLVAYTSNASTTSPTLSLVIACFGVICSTSWLLVNRASKAWQAHFVKALHLAEKDLFGERRFINPHFPNAPTSTEPTPTKELRETVLAQFRASLSSVRQKRFFSVTEITILLSDFSLAIWVLAMLRSARKVLLPDLPTLMLFSPQTERVTIAVCLPLGTLLFLMFMYVQSSRCKDEPNNSTQRRPPT